MRKFILQHRRVVLQGVLLPLLLMGSGLAIVLTCCALFYSWVGYRVTTFPIPEPYPGIQPVQISFSSGAGKRERVFEYTVDRPLAVVIHDYGVEMEKLCKAGWHFTPQYDACGGAQRCYYAACDMPRPGVSNAQSFHLQLWQEASNSTHVYYIVETLDP